MRSGPLMLAALSLALLATCTSLHSPSSSPSNPLSSAHSSGLRLRPAPVEPENQLKLHRAGPRVAQQLRTTSAVDDDDLEQEYCDTCMEQYIAAAEIAARRNAERLASTTVEYYERANQFFLNRLRGGKRSQKKAKEESEEEDEEEEDEDESDEIEDSDDEDEDEDEDDEDSSSDDAPKRKGKSKTTIKEIKEDKGGRKGKKQDSDEDEDEDEDEDDEEDMKKSSKKKQPAKPKGGKKESHGKHKRKDSSEEEDDDEDEDDDDEDDEDEEEEEDDEEDDS